MEVLKDFNGKNENPLMNERFILGWPFVAFDWQGL
jgi:hypothetical protein